MMIFFNILKSSLENQIIFDGEVALNYIEIKNYILSNTIPLIGPPTGHAWIDLGPLFYWIMILFFKIFGFSPLVVHFMFIVLQIVTAILCFIVVRELVDRRTAIISTFLILFSPFWLTLFRYSRFYLFAVPLSFLFIHFFAKGIKKSDTQFYISFFILGIIFNFHLSVLVLIFASLATVFIFNRYGLLPKERKLITIKNCFYSLLFFLIPNIPFLIINIQNKFDPIIKLMMWIPYRFIKLIWF